MRFVILSSATSKVLIIGETSVTGAISRFRSKAFFFCQKESSLLNYKNSFLLPPPYFTHQSALWMPRVLPISHLFFQFEYKIESFITSPISSFRLLPRPINTEKLERKMKIVSGFLLSSRPKFFLASSAPEHHEIFISISTNFENPNGTRMIFFFFVFFEITEDKRF